MHSVGDSRYSPLFVKFIHHFNGDRDYYECHEVLEELWMEEGRDPLYQGLLQVAVALYHHRNGNVNGARKLFRGALGKLEYQPEDALGIDLAAFRRDAQARLDVLEQSTEAPFPERHLNIRVLDPLLREQVEAMGRESGIEPRGTTGEKEVL
ncbi:DUF309 domain-containing protein [Kroppenstedtia eburnea]|uniref:DUF309 domain-containing protein n=1 Tax=Kroppenstedtia eburnea TaxID=714067 RepID=UPI00363E2661